ncbi:MAG: hypothetical protein REH83_02765 [Rickettsiella sp.]|nr:hypothetical protein [Rickettsiella sp.]
MGTKRAKIFREHTDSLATKPDNAVKLPDNESKVTENNKAGSSNCKKKMVKKMIVGFKIEPLM